MTGCVSQPRAALVRWLTPHADRTSWRPPNPECPAQTPTLWTCRCRYECYDSDLCRKQAMAIHATQNSPRPTSRGSNGRLARALSLQTPARPGGSPTRLLLTFLLVVILDLPSLVGSTETAQTVLVGELWGMRLQHNRALPVIAAAVGLTPHTTAPRTIAGDCTARAQWRIGHRGQPARACGHASCAEQCVARCQRWRRCWCQSGG